VRRLVRRYGPLPDQLGELFLPDGAPRRPVVVLHGGYWRARYDRHLMDALCLDLCARGAAAWNVEYRRVGAGGGWPATFEDVAAATDALLELAAETPLALAAGVAAVGHSAGGQLALWLAARARLPAGAPGAAPRVRPARVAAQAPVADLREAARRRLSDRAAQGLLGGEPDACAERYALASPAERVPLGVPQLLVHTADDADVPLAQSRGYAAAARAAGDDVELAEPAGDHYVHLDPAGEAWRRTAAWLLR
jgi:acetyl esterase/lipase